MPSQFENIAASEDADPSKIGSTADTMLDQVGYQKYLCIQRFTISNNFLLIWKHKAFPKK